MPLGDAAGDLSSEKAPYFSIILIYKGAEDWIAQAALPVAVANEDTGSSDQRA